MRTRISRRSLVHASMRSVQHARLRRIRTPHRPSNVSANGADPISPQASAPVTPLIRFSGVVPFLAPRRSTPSLQMQQNVASKTNM